MENFVHRNGALGALVTDLSGAFDCLQHSPPAKKLHANGINKISTEYLRDYLRHWKQNYFLAQMHLHLIKAVAEIFLLKY